MIRKNMAKFYIPEINIKVIHIGNAPCQGYFLFSFEKTIAYRNLKTKDFRNKNQYADRYSSLNKAKKPASLVIE